MNRDIFSNLSLFVLYMILYITLVTELLALGAPGLRPTPQVGHLAALTRSHLIGDHPSGLTKEQTTNNRNNGP